MTEVRDELLDRIVEELRTLPPVDETTVTRIVTAASAQRAAAASEQRVGGLGSWWRSRIPLAAAAGLTLAAGIAGYAIGDRRTHVPIVAGAQAPAPSVAVTPASLRAAPSQLPAFVPTQFVLEAPRASRVALVGDFNSWDATGTPLDRVAPSGIWTVTIPLAPGRHTYGFMVDGKVWTLDPRAPTAQDPDFGTPSSVVLVGTK